MTREILRLEKNGRYRSKYIKLNFRIIDFKLSDVKVDIFITHRYIKLELRLEKIMI